MSRPDTFAVGYGHVLRLELGFSDAHCKTFQTTIQYVPCPSVAVHLAGHRSWWLCDGCGMRFDGKRAKYQLFDHLFHGHYYDVVPTMPFQRYTAPGRGTDRPQGYPSSCRVSR